MGPPLIAKAMLAAAAAAGLAGCDAVPRFRAAEGVHAFLTAVQKDDKTAFNARVDRPQLKDDVRRQVAAAAAGEGFGSGAASGALGGPMADALMDRLISPETFRIVWMRSGVSIRRPPSALELVPMLRMISDDRACLRAPRGGHCVLTFQDEGGMWKLTGLRADLSEDEQAANA